METGVEDLATIPSGEQLVLVPDAVEPAASFLSRLKPKHARLGFAALSLAAGVIGGIGVGVYEARSTQTQLLPGVGANISPVVGRGASIQAGPLGSLYLPSVHEDVPLIGEVSGNVRLDNLNLSSQNLNELAASIDNPTQIVEAPLKKKMLDHLESDTRNGLGSGLLAAMVLIGADSLAQRRRRDEIKQEIDCLNSFTPYVSPRVMALMSDKLMTTKDTIHKDIGRRNLRVAAAVGVTALLVAVPSAFHFAPSSINQTAFDSVDPSLTEGIGYLNGAEVTAGSPLEQMINVGLPAVLDLKQSIDQSYSAVLPGLNQAIDRFKNSTVNAKWLNDPNLVMALDNSNLHCDFPYETVVLPAITGGLLPRIIINSGDTMISSDSMPFEDQCVSIQASALEADVKASGKSVNEVTIKGEDDSETTVQLQRALSIKGPDGKLYDPIIPLDSYNGYIAQIDGLSFVGAPDPRQHISSEPMLVNGKPVDSLLESQTLEQSGESLAKIACSDYEKAGTAPIMIVHNGLQASQSTYEGCISTALSSEGDWHGGVSVATSVMGTPVSQLIEGTSSGADYNGFAPYAKRAYDAPSTILFFNRQTNRLVASSQLVISTTGETSISNIEPIGS